MFRLANIYCYHEDLKIKLDELIQSMLKASITALVVLLFSPIIAAQEKQTIIWAVGHNPPRIAIDDRGILSGQGGIQQHILQAGLSEYNHIHEVTSFRKFFDDVANGRHVCSSFLFKTPERENNIVFSVPWHIDLPPRIILRRETYESLGEPESLSMQALLVNENINGAVQTLRSFSSLDGIINNVPNNNLEQLEIPIPKFIDMLNAGRIDYTVAYSHLVNYIQKSNQISDEHLVHVPIEEGFEYAFTYVGCPKTAWGEQVIAAINPVIEAERAKSSYLNLLKMLHTNKVNRDTIDKVYHQSFIHSK